MILDPSLAMAYIVVAVVLAVSPGPDVLFVIANGMQHRARGAVASALGIACGSLVHAFAAAVGISAVIAASAIAFDLLRICGALYLAYLGFQALRSWYRGADDEAFGIEQTEVSGRQIFQRGLTTNLLNPKVILFYFALLPQFVNPDIGYVGVQVFLLGCIHNAIGLIFLLCVGLVSGKASGWLSKSGFKRWLDGLAGLFFIGLALRIAFSNDMRR